MDEDQAFVTAVGAFMSNDFQLLQKNVETQIEEYLKKRVRDIERISSVERQTLEASHSAEMESKQEVINSLESEKCVAVEERRRCLEELDRFHQERLLQRYWNTWVSFLKRTKCQRKIVETLEASTKRALVARRWWLWRLHAMTKKQRKQSETVMRSREKKLTAEMEGLRAEIVHREEQQRESNEQTKTAFVRGVCALNREAVQILRGETGETEVEAIESILRGGATPSACISGNSLFSASRPRGTQGRPEYSEHVTPRPGSNGLIPSEHHEDGGLEERFSHHPSDSPSLPGWRGPAGSGSAHSGGGGGGGSGSGAGLAGAGYSGGICPVHNVDQDGNFYHKCYAKNRPRAHHVSTHTPFIVRVDPNQGIPVGAAAPVKKR